MESPHGRDSELLADLARKAIVDLTMAWNRSFCAACRIREDRVTAAFPDQNASVTAQIVEQFVSFHLGAVPA